MFRLDWGTYIVHKVVKGCRIQTHTTASRWYRPATATSILTMLQMPKQSWSEWSIETTVGISKDRSGTSSEVDDCAYSWGCNWNNAEESKSAWNSLNGADERRWTSRFTTTRARGYHCGHVTSFMHQCLSSHWRYMLRYLSCRGICHVAVSVMSQYLSYRDLSHTHLQQV